MMNIKVSVFGLVIAMAISFLPQSVHAALPTSNLLLDLRAGVGITETTDPNDEHGITVWADQSGNGLDFHSPGTSGTMPESTTIDIGGNVIPATYWAGASGMRLDAASEMINGDFTIFVLMKAIGGGAQERIMFSDYGYVDNHEMLVFDVETNGSVKVSVRDWYSQTIQVIGGNGTSDYSVVTAKLSGKTLTLYQNGSSLGSATGDGNWLAPSFSYSGGRLPAIGNLSGSNYGPFAGDLLEVVIYSSALDDTTRNQVESELASRLAPALNLRGGVGITVTGENGEITVWADQSGNGRDFNSPGTTGTMPQSTTVDIDGNMVPTTYWQGTSEVRLDSTSEMINGDFTISILVKAIAGGQERIMFSDYGYVDNHELFTFEVETDGSIKTQVRDWYNQTIQVTGGDGISDYSVVTAKLSGKTLTLYQNGVSLGSATGDSNWLAPSFSYSGGRLPAIGNLSGSNYGPFAGHLFEVVIYSFALNDTTRNQVETKLASRFALESETCAEAILGYVKSGDLNNDCRIDFRDSALLAQQWLGLIDPAEL